jgi:hypothetical protein
MKQSEHPAASPAAIFLPPAPCCRGSDPLLPPPLWAVAASRRPRAYHHGCAGMGMMGPHNRPFLGRRLPDSGRMRRGSEAPRGGVNRINKHDQEPGLQDVHRYRELMARKDLDNVILALPTTCTSHRGRAALRKKDITRKTPRPHHAEQQAIVKACGQPASGRRLRQRSQAPFRKAAEIVRNG